MATRPNLTRRKGLAVKLTLLAIVLLTLVFASGGQAHATRWYWSSGYAVDYLVGKEFEYEDDYATVGVIDDASCRGYGASIRGRGGIRLYKHFLCAGDAYSDEYGYDTFRVRVHVRGRFPRGTWHFVT
jgi:hypothetical protein